jgi:urea transport system substrate-binding protein
MSDDKHPDLHATIPSSAAAQGPAAHASSGRPDFLLPATGDELGWLEHYRVLAKLGEGGMGIVFRAEDTHLKRVVALKVLQPASAADPAARLRFVREAQAMAAVAHDHVVTIFQVGLGKGACGQEVPFLSMQYLEGESLEEYVIRLGRLPPGEVVRIGRETAEGLAAAHERGLIHRDIKLANIWLEGPRKRVKILDFGLARAVHGNQNLSATGQVLGTPYFMAPEQARGDPVDFRTDLFSLGVVLYTLLAGELPFDGPSLMAVLTKLAVEEPAPLAIKAPDTPRPLAELIGLLMAKKPEARPASATIVGRALGEIEPACIGFGRTLEVNAAIPPGLPSSLYRGAEPTIPSSSKVSAETLPGAGGSPAAPTSPAPPSRIGRRAVLAGAGALACAGLGWLGYAAMRRFGSSPEPNVPTVPTGEPIVVGILHSQSGTLRASEQPVQEMTQLALDEINNAGGLLGRPIHTILRDGASDERIFAREAERLIRQDKVSAIFGCWTSASRKAVKEVIERHKNVLVYPVQYEGVEESSYIVYTGATPNQQILPAIDWCLDQERKRAVTFFHVGSDYIFPRTAGDILRHYLKEKGGQLLGEEYLLLGEVDTRAVVEKIKEARPDFILNTINGSTNIPFFEGLRKAGITPQKTPTISFSVDAASLRDIDARKVAGDYAAWSYFASLPGKRNKEFIQRYQQRWGEFKPVTDAMEAAWIGVQLWAKAVRIGGSADPESVVVAIDGLSLDAPEGDGVSMDKENQHTWKYFNIGQVTPDGTFRVVHSLPSTLPPIPYPSYKTKAEWEQFQLDLYNGWGKRWSRSGG